jgi:hypothetical protein
MKKKKKKKKREANEVTNAKNLHLILDHLCCNKSPFPQIVWNVWMRDVFALFVGIFLKKKKEKDCPSSNSPI